MKLEQMPDHARLWVYQADRRLSEKELVIVQEEAEQFVKNWAAHGQSLKSVFEIKFDQFLILAVDESHHVASGCSIDDSVGLVKSLERRLGLSFLDRTKVALLENDEIRIIPFNSVKTAIDSGHIKKDSQIINNSVASYAEFKSSWIQLAGNSWVKRYF